MTTPHPTREDILALAPPFDPVPLRRVRWDGWTPEKQHLFLSVLAMTASVATAARTLGMSRKSAYDLRRRPGAESFARAWDTAIAAARVRAIDVLMERATNGVTTVRVGFGGTLSVKHGPDQQLMLRAATAHPGNFDNG